MLLLSPTYTLVLFFFNDTATTEIYTLSLHDALPILALGIVVGLVCGPPAFGCGPFFEQAIFTYSLHPDLPLASFAQGDRKSTRLNSSHANISYAVFCLKKKKTRHNIVCCVLLTKIRA